MIASFEAEGAPADAPLIELERARIRHRGALGGELSVTSAGALVVLVGDFSPLFALLSRSAELYSGIARVLGADAELAVQSRAVGLARADTRLPPEWTPERYLTESASLAGMSPREAARAVDEALVRLELARDARRRLADLAPAFRRVLLLAHATLGAPRALAVEDLLGGVDAGTQAYLASALERAVAGRPLLAGVRAVPAVGPERVLVERASSVVVERGGRATVSTVEAVLGAGTRYSALVTHSGDEFAARLLSSGIASVRTAANVGLLGFTPRDPASVGRFVFDLPEGRTTADVVRAAHEAGAPLVELVREG
jgi:hypothetical protein